MSFNNDSKQRLIAIAAVFFVGLLGINAYLVYNKINQDRVIAERNEQLDEAEKLKADLQKTYYEALSELEEMRGNNEELNLMIDQQKEDLKAQKEKIDRLISSGSAGRRELDQARQQMSEMRIQLEQYVAENTKLKEEKEQLAMANQELSQERDLLQETVSKERQMNEELATAKAALVTEKESLESMNTDLSKKVNIASVIKVANLKVTGEKIRKSGKAVSKKYAKSVDRIKICFNATENLVAGRGMEKFFIRILNPLGETIAMEEMGSGIMVSNASDEQMRYTAIKEIDYTQEEVATCFNWQPANANFSKGRYEVEIYNKGFLAGKGSVQLK